MKKKRKKGGDDVSISLLLTGVPHRGVLNIGVSSLQAKNKKKKKDDRKGKGKAAQRFDEKGEKKERKAGDEGDEYDSGDEVVADDEDRNFLASDDSDDDLGLGETYNKKQNFDDDRPEGYVEPKQSKKGKSGGGGGGGGGRLKNSDNPLDQALARLAAGKSRRAVDIDERKLQETVQDFLYSMDEAAEEDRKSRSENKPAVKKIAMLPKVLKMIGNKLHQSCLLEFDLLGAIKKWISPLDDG
jgi:transcription factor SPN1